MLDEKIQLGNNGENPIEPIYEQESEEYKTQLLQDMENSMSGMVRSNINKKEDIPYDTFVEHIRAKNSTADAKVISLGDVKTIKDIRIRLENETSTNIGDMFLQNEYQKLKDEEKIIRIASTRYEKYYVGLIILANNAPNTIADTKNLFSKVCKFFNYKE